MESFDAIVIGAGFCGLGAGAALRAKGVTRFAILEQGGEVGHFWTRTYDRIHLHSAFHDLPDDGGCAARLRDLPARATSCSTTSAATPSATGWRRTCASARASRASRASSHALGGRRRVAARDQRGHRCARATSPSPPR